MSVLFLWYPRCSTCRKAKAWLDEHDVSYEARDLVEDRPQEAELRSWHGQSGLPLKRFFNTSGVLYREMGLAAKLKAGLSDDECFALLASDGKLVKRPIVVGEDFVLVGFKAEAWAEALGA